MSQTLTEIAQQLSTPKVVKKTIKTKQIPPREIEESKPVPKVQLIYAFNGSGKTQLSKEFKKLIVPKFDDIENFDDVENVDDIGETRKKILYYNAFTEDLFYWDNDLAEDTSPKLIIQPNTYTNWLIQLLKDLGHDQKITTNFQHYTNDKLTPKFNVNFSEVTFSFETGDDQQSDNIKISKGEESNFVWSVFFTLLEQVISILNDTDPTERPTDQFDELEYVFIDDPVSSLDENHLIQLAVNLALLIKASSSKLKFIITTHSPLFYNVLYNEINSKTCYLLGRSEGGTFTLEEKQGDSNKSFSYHLYLKDMLEKAIADNQIEKYHFTLLRNLYEKTASFLGYREWKDLLPGDTPDDKNPYYYRIIQFTSHSSLSNEVVADPTPEEKQIVKFLLEHLVTYYRFWEQEEQEQGNA